MYQEVSDGKCDSAFRRPIGFGAGANHGEIIALISGQDFSARAPQLNVPGPVAPD